MRAARPGLSSVYGFIMIFALLMAGMGAALTIMNSQASVWSAQDRARQIQSDQQSEHLALSLNGSSLVIQNDGLIPSQILYLLQKNSDSSSSERIGASVQEGRSMTIPLSAGMSEFAVITSLGNVFWVANSTQSTQDTETTVPITFDASGLDPSFGTSVVLTVDGTSYQYSAMPKTFEWSPGSQHSYSYAEALATNGGSRIGWSYARGLASSISGILTASQPGDVVSTYTQQYLLTVDGGSAPQYVGSPTDDGWFDAGSSAQVSSNYVWNLQPGTRQDLYSYSIDGSSPTIVPRSGTGTYLSVGLTMNAPHTIALNGITQYQLTVDGGSGISYSAASQTNDGWYDSGSSLTVTTNYVWGVVVGQSRQNLGSWSLDGGPSQSVPRSGSGVFTTAPILMNSSHTVNLGAVTQYFVTTTPSIQQGGSLAALPVSYSYTSAPTVTSSLNCPGFECYPTGTMADNPWFGVGASQSIVSSPVHSGSEALLSTAGTADASIGLPANAVLTSIAYSAWVYGGTGTAQIGVNCGSYQDTKLASTSVSGGSGWNEFSGSWSGSCAPPMNENAACSYSNLGGFSLASPCVTIFAGPGACKTCSGMGYFDDFAWSVTYYYPASGSVSSTSNGYTVNGDTVTYSYGVGFSFPTGSSSPVWSASWSPYAETYASNNCAGGSVAGATITGTGGPCTLQTTRSGTVPISLRSPTGDGWLDAGVAAALSSSPTGPFVFSSWSASSGGVAFASSGSASTTVTVSTYGTVTANFLVSQ